MGEEHKTGLAKVIQARRQLCYFFTTLDICNSNTWPGAAFIPSHIPMYIKATKLMPGLGWAVGAIASGEEERL